MKLGTVFPSAIFFPVIVLPVVSLLIMGAARRQQGVSPKRGEKTSSPTFYKDVLPILQNKCQSCHRSGEAAPMPLVSYEQTRPWARKMADAVEMKMMPPWFADPRYG